MRFHPIFAGLLLTTSLVLADEHGANAKKSSQLEVGRQIFTTNCAACHGPGGKGDGAAAVALEPKPRNLTDVAYMKTRPKETIRKVITEGGSSVGLSPIMVGWSGTLDHEQIEAVMKYVLSLSKSAKGKKAKAAL